MYMQRTLRLALGIRITSHLPPVKQVGDNKTQKPQTAVKRRQERRFREENRRGGPRMSFSIFGWSAVV
jgi:hypothetical protein